ncbi:MAG: insulinase family protein [Bacteroidetes bacterium]|nr:MAG: insulinase family protein [Bacteroidota bacterium]
MNDIPGYTFQKEAGGVLNYTMDSNGLEVLVYPQDLAPVSVFMVTYRVGSRNESTGETGVTHFLEHMMFKGTDRFNKESGTSVFNELQKSGARVNATTWMDRTNYYALLPTERIEKVIEIEADRMRGARLWPEDVASEKTVILNEHDQGENEPSRKLYQSVWSTAYVAHPYRHPTIGWRSDIEDVSAESLRSYYDRYYWPSNATVSVIGSFDVGDTLALIRSHFEGIERGPDSYDGVSTREPDQLGERRTTIRMAGEPAMLMIAYRGLAATDSDAAALSVLGATLSLGKMSRMQQQIADKGLVVSISAVSSAHAYPGLFYIFAAITPGQSHDDVEVAIQAVLDEVLENGITQEELDRARSQFIAQAAFSRDGAYSVASGLNEAIAVGDWTLFTSAEERVRAVTVENVNAVARRIILPDSRVVGQFEPAR